MKQGIEWFRRSRKKFELRIKKELKQVHLAFGTLGRMGECFHNFGKIIRASLRLGQISRF